MSYRAYGVIGILAFFAAAAVGVFGLARPHVVAMAGVRPGLLPAVLYGLIVLAATWTILYAYCAKCACRRKHCSHVFVGSLTVLVPRRAPAPYHRGDHAALLAALGVVALAPQPWLLAAPRLLALFWGLFALAAGLIVVRVCPACRNSRCPMWRWRRPGGARA